MIHLNNVGFFPLTVTGKPVGEKKAHLKTTCDKVAQIFFCFVLLCLDLYFPFFCLFERHCAVCYPKNCTEQ